MIIWDIHWQPQKQEPFEVKASENWSIIEDQGIDTYIGRITNGMGLFFLTKDISRSAI
jgi:hypothetical protein